MKTISKDEEQARVLITALLDHFGYKIASGLDAELSRNAFFIIDKETHAVIDVFWIGIGCPFFLSVVNELRQKNTLRYGGKEHNWMFFNTLDELDIQLTLMGIHP